MGLPSFTRPELTVPDAAEASAMVVFPDDFAVEALGAFVRGARARHPAMLIVLVTRRPDLCEPFVASDGVSLAPVVLAKPAFASAIVDAIRNHGAPS
jgi:hypothetical protein